VFVSHSIGTELRRIIEYLNRQMSATEVLAIEVKPYTDADGAHQTIGPRVVGDTAEARALHGLASVPPFPASHGCIRVPLEFAPLLNKFDTVGTEIDVLA
jgi:hypothetical protein